MSVSSPTNDTGRAKKVTCSQALMVVMTVNIRSFTGT
jgi:hypothetical protein